MDWYSVRCVIKWGIRNTFEERITLWLAESPDHAIEKAEADARLYARRNAGGSYAGLAQCYHIGDTDIRSGAEVFSLLRTSELDVDEYLSAYFDTSAERSQ
jgi:hypothetical protein